ncbi:hypothetical protein [uncultured Methanobrevibacter sp.]|uniref:hypothetical protein n=1 Tax=uncultured Methanobrevibacter sp. TaxID=253161 RepID=UPI0025E57E89|nr:hypothetical protein [uncultured Methanobrevibacter sp.]
MSNKTAIISVFLIVGLVACGLGNIAALVTGPLNVQFPTNNDTAIVATNSDANYTSISDTISQDSNVYEVSSDNSHTDTSTYNDNTHQDNTHDNTRGDDGTDDGGSDTPDENPDDSGSDSGGKSQDKQN